MAQENLTLLNQSRTAYRAQHNNVNAALASKFSGVTAPAAPVAFQWWQDLTSGILKMRNAANNAWEACAVLIASQAQAEAGLDNTAAMTALRTKQAIDANIGDVFSPTGPKIFGTSIGTASDHPVLTISASDLFPLGFAVQDVAGIATISTATLTMARTHTVVGVTGSARFKATQNFTGSNYAGTHTARIYKNDVLVQSWAVSTNGAYSRSVDIGVVPGDVIRWSHQNGYQAGYYSSSLSVGAPTATDGLTSRAPLLAYSDL